ncbi:type II toxin-antitoxin system antitoxin DNA ADP-ribosyl glycohydrolase DarG [Inconstantimicrobium porci]|uniref:Appr-1-p processing protein n=1 Tax=Inconstantimicrobium porci TaxID=2652291 RepID=A0A7X2MYC6_9CLOT|nr:macro domain-containing protein [Inconstantimicrobium porci]MSR91361.1 Appr-1-p processing protein [Inconstantimicrobium porci]
MMHYTTGDLLKSSAEALVNTVNCEGYMGKGIAYQFKMQYPENNKDYVKACKSGELTVGKLHYFKEKGKIIVNFPTKNKWRANSKIEYINDGLDELIKLIHQLNIKSIAIPPLGSGNGGLIWSEVKEIIEKKLSVLDDRIDIFIYEPSQNYVSLPTVEPKLSMSALVLMEMKKDLNKFDTLRLQKTAYFMNIFAKEQYFEFKKHKYGPYANSISIISRTIREFQKYHNVKNTQEAYKILYNKIISEKIQNRMKILTPSILKATQYVNSIETNHELECIATVAFIIEKQNGLSGEEILQHFKGWSIDKATRFSNDDILEGIKKLYNDGIIEKNLTGYVLA